MYTKFSEKLTFLTPWYTHVRVRIKGLDMLVSRKILRTYLMDDPRALSAVNYFHKIIDLNAWQSSEYVSAEGPSITYVSNIFRKTNIFHPLIRMMPWHVSRG